MRTTNYCSCLSASGSFFKILTTGNAYTMSIHESLVLECEFSTEYFYLFDNPVLWMKTQQNEATYINLMGNINKPFAATGRFEVSFTPEPPRYHLELAIVGEWWQRARGSAEFTFVHSHRGATGIFLPISHVVYFRCGAKLTDP